MEKNKPPKNEIELFFHCANCIPGEEKTYQQNIECGWTKKGFQVWCKTCNKQIIHIDFRGQKVGNV